MTATVVHHRVLSRASVQHWRDVLARETPEQRLGHPGMVVGREDVLVAGLYVLDAVMECFGVEWLISSENDILDGIVASLRPLIAPITVTCNDRRVRPRPW